MKEKILKLQKEIDTIIKEMQDSLKTRLNEYFKENPLIDSVSVNLNNHEFNDGDATYFGFHYEGLTLKYSDELGNEYEFSGYEEDAPKGIEKSHKELVSLFKDFDVSDFYEKMFGDYYEEVSFEMKKGKLEIS